MKNFFKELQVEIYQCPVCEEWVYSRAQHDMKYCKCKALAVDGGHYDKDIWTAQRFLGNVEIISKTITLKGVTEKMLYDDWNNDTNLYGDYND